MSNPYHAQPSQNRPAAGSMSRLLKRFDRLHSRRKMLFLFHYRQEKKKAEKTCKKKLSDNNLKVSVPTMFTSLEFLKTQTSFQSFFNYKSGNIHRLYLSIGKKMSLSCQAFDWQLESNLPGFVVYYIYSSVQ